MSIKSSATDETNYLISRTFGTKPIFELIADNVEKLCNSQNLLTGTAANDYNINESVEEVVDENR